MHAVEVWNDADRRAAATAATQLGLMTTSDLRSAGLTPSAILRRTREGILIRRRSGIYAFAGTPEFERQDLALEVMSVDARAALSHDSAAYEWGLLSRRPAQIHVVVRRWRREHRVSAAVHESLDFTPRDRVTVDGLPITIPVRTIIDLGATSRWLVESALSRGIRNGLLNVDEIDVHLRRIARRGRRGVGVIRPLLDIYRGTQMTESILEDRFLQLVRRNDMTPPEPQFVVRTPSGEVICRADFAYPESRLLVELDGRAYHSGEDAFQRDRDKQNRTQELGWTTLRFTWYDVVMRPDYTAARLHRMLRVLA